MKVCARLSLSASCSGALTGSAFAQDSLQDIRDTGQAPGKGCLKQGMGRMRVDDNCLQDQAAVAHLPLLNGRSPRRIEPYPDCPYDRSCMKSCALQT